MKVFICSLLSLICSTAVATPPSSVTRTEYFSRQYSVPSEPQFVYSEAPVVRERVRTEIRYVERPQRQVVFVERAPRKEVKEVVTKRQQGFFGRLFGYGNQSVERTTTYR